MQKHSRIVLTLIIVLSAISCSNQKKDKPFTAAEHQQFKENLVKANRGLLDIDKERIEAFIKRRNWNMQTTETGLWYEIYEQGDGDKPQKGQVVTLNYSVMLLDGTLCYSSDSTGAMTVKISHSNIETGLDQALLMMQQGDKGRFIMPPHLAHGLLGDENKIPPRSVIVYQAELIKLGDY